MGTIQTIVNSSSLALFAVATGYALLNIYRFWRMMTFHMGILYTIAMLNLLLRCAYFILKYFATWTYWNLILLVMPDCLGVSLVLAQTMIYLILYVEVSFYLKNREQLTVSRSSRISKNVVRAKLKKERLILVVMSFIIAALILYFSILLFLHANDNDKGKTYFE